MLLRLTELRVPPWSARTPLHVPSRPAPCGAGQDMAKRSPSSQKIGRLLQHPPSPLSTRSRNRVRYKVGCLRVPMRDVCWGMRGAWGAGGAPVSSGHVRRRGLRVCLVHCSCFGLYTIFSIFYIRFWDLSTKNIFEYFSNIEDFGGEYSNIFRI